MMILDDCAASRGVKQRRNELMDLTFSARHKGISVWVLKQRVTSIAKPLREHYCISSLVHTICKSYEDHLRGLEE